MTQDDEELPRSESINEPPGSNVYGKAVPEGLGKPSISSLDPDSCAIGDDSFTLEVHGENFFDGSVIVFAGHDEPTTWDEAARTLSTGVDMSVWQGPDMVKVSVRNGSVMSNEVSFAFNEAGAGTHDLSDPDEMEEEIEEEMDEAVAKKANHKTPPSKRKR